MDNFSKETRSLIMSRVKSEDTRPEKIVRSIVHSLGYRYGKNKANLPGTPDIVLPKYKKVIFVHGCFWHGHKNCKKSKLPATNEEFWKIKITKNMRRDKKVGKLLGAQGWDVLIVWECQLRNTVKIKNKIENFLKQPQKRP